MKRELAGMTEAQVTEWACIRRAEIHAAYLKRAITIDVQAALYAWVSTELSAWYTAKALGFLGEEA